MLESSFPVASTLSTSTRLVEPSPLAAPALAGGQVSAIAFVDAALSDYQTLVDGLSAHTAVYVLNPAGDELSQISQVLAGYQNLDSVSIFSHGNHGALKLGNQQIDADALTGVAGTVQSWAGALSAEADVLLYGCNLAADPTGQAFVQQFAALTGADVAASTDLTGSSALGGDWDLEFSTGSIETSEFLAPWAQAAYQSVLATYTVNAVADTDDADPNNGTTTLREAIALANASTSVADTIRFDLPVNSTITVTSTLDISPGAETTIDGSAIKGLTLSGGGTTSLFFVSRSAALSLNGLTIRDGNGGLSTNGGGINNLGTLTVQNSTFRNNFARSAGGAIGGFGTLTVINSTFTGNSAGSRGGAIDGNTMTVSNSTIAGNFALDYGGGISVYFGSLTLNNSIVANNSSNTNPGLGNIEKPFSGSNNLVGGNPQLAALADNGGPTQTMALLDGSPAINAGNNDLIPASTTTDQRGAGFARIIGGTVDIGAFESAFVPPNSAPNATDNSFTVAEDNTLTIDAAGVLADDTDVDGNPLTASLVAGPSNGTLTLRTDGSFVYTPNPNFNGTDSFTYRANDGTAFSNPATVTLTVTSVNDAPTITAPTSPVNVQSGGTTISGISIDDVDAGSGTLATTLSVGNGTLTLTNLNGATATGLDTGSVTLSGTLTQIKAALTSLRYNSGTFSGNTSLAVTVNDNGNTGSGGARTTTLQTPVLLKVATNVGTLGNSIVNRTGTVNDSDTIDRYQFTLNSLTTNFRLTLRNLTSNADVFILDSNGGEMRSSINTGTSAEVINGLSLAAGTYFIEVRRVSGSTGYNLSFRR